MAILTELSEPSERQRAVPDQMDPAAVLAELVPGETPVSGAPLQQKSCGEILLLV